MLRVFFVVSLSLVLFFARAQERCGTVQYQKLLQQRNPSRETTDQFESWIKNKIAQKAAAFKANRVESSNYVVPVVVHVIHNGEAVGTGTNISDAQILSQIPVLNNDYNRLNSDASNTLAEFTSVAGEFPITFVMAKQDPDGLATNGIVRVKGTQTSWDISDNYTFKALSYWPAEDYLNIWIVDLTGGLIGYTQLPVSSTLQGLQDASNDRLTDGVVVDYQTYGTSQASGGSAFNLLSEYALGRTATHEIGHFFGLRHVWGDVNSCDPSVSTDYVSDTPIQNTDYNGLCPTGIQVECNVHTMYSNYMNYTDDACMNIFSQGQVDRMDVIINNGPRRASLLTSPGLQPPSPVANDLGIKTIDVPGATACQGSVTPSITIRNFGSNSISSAQILFYLNGNSTETKTFSPLSLASTDETSVSFSSVPVNAGSSNVFAFKIIQTNAGTDGNPANDSLAISTLIPGNAALPLIEPFNTTPTGWQITNPDELITWSNISLSGSNNAMYLNFYNYDNAGSSDMLITPVLDLTTATTASLSFDYAYAQYQQGTNDGLRVLVSSVCDFSGSPVVIFDKSGSSLATATATSSSFTPTASQWTTSVISLNQFIGQKIQIAFEGINDYGNNLYLDNVSVLNNPLTSFVLSALVSPSPVSCTANVSPVITVKNMGNTNINSFTVNVYVNGQKTTQQVTAASLDFAVTKNFTLSSASFANGNNTLAIAIKSPNGIAGAISATDSLSTNLVINSATDVIPLRENFDDNFTSAWSIVSPQAGQVWYQAKTNKSISLLFSAFGYPTLGEQSWLVSPVLDFSNTKTASVFFETSYAFNTSGSETLQVYSSTDCGETFNKLLFTSSGSSLSNTNSSTSWLPSNDSQWTKNYVNLDSVAGKENVRLAFVATNGDGNNLYIDNIEFFANDNSSPASIDGLYSVYGGQTTPVQVTFNLPDRQPVRMQVYDMLGHAVSDNLFPDTLNQTYTLDFPYGAGGVYIVRVQTATSLSSTKVLLGY